MSDACPTLEQLATLLEHEPDAETRERLESHVGGCPRCQRELLALAGDLHTPVPELDAGIAPPRSFLERLRQLVADDAASDPGPHAVASPALPKLADLEILEQLDRGGTSVVYRARQISLDRIVALKVVPIGQMPLETLQRNRRGVELLARLTHPGIVQVFMVGRQGDLAFGLLEYVAGGNLKRHIAKALPDSTWAAERMATVASVVHFIHQNGVVHRDLKTANILLTEAGAPKVADFGLARYLDGADDITRPGEIMGTPNYMAPEQATTDTDRAPIGIAADIYALGVILYELLTGRVPFHGATPLDTLYQVVHLPAMPPSRLRPQIPAELETICLKCLRKDPAERYATAQHLADDLGRFLRHEPIQARPAGTFERFSKWLNRRPDLAFLFAALFVLALTAITLLTMERRALRAALADESALRTQDAKTLEASETKRHEANLHLYRTRLALAKSALAANSAADARVILQQCAPIPGDPDLRDAEWHELMKRTK